MARRTYTLKQLLAALEGQGWRIEQAGSGHVKAWPANRMYGMVTIGSTDSDHRGMKNTVARLRARGAKL